MLRFRLFGIPVGVHVTFLFIALLGATAYRGFDIALWTVAVFLAILAHEMGHALTARAFDAKDVSVTLYGLGGVTTYRHGANGMTHGRSFFVSAAGSFVGIVLGGAVWLLGRNGAFSGVSPEVEVFLESFVFAALVWGVLNWVPIVPLDGGHMVESLAAMVNERRAPLIGQIVTWVAVAIVVPLALVNGQQFAAILVVLFALAGIRDYRAKVEAQKAKDREDARARGVVIPDDVQSPPSSSSPPSADRPPQRSPSDDGDHARRPDTPEFPI
ncbi:MAG: hypothetical protein QNJ71_03345 [Acidimicrobiia bacterium]|nr:hypothetical protein [Acidimicrobiia bacterium]